MRNPTPFRLVALMIVAFGWALALSANAGFTAIVDSGASARAPMEYDLSELEIGPLSEPFPPERS